MRSCPGKNTAGMIKKRSLSVNPVHSFCVSTLIQNFTKIRQKCVRYWGKVGLIRTSGKFGHTFANSGNPDETAPNEVSSGFSLFA